MENKGKSGDNILDQPQGAQSEPADSTRKINAAKFYFEYKGHPVEDLALFHSITRAERPGKPVIFLAGDSSLDNKYWLHKTVEDIGVDVPSIYYQTLDKPKPKPDVAFWMNHELGESATCINTAIEESMLRERDDTKLLPQDEFIRDNIRPEDVLIVSVGNNDVAFKPLPSTIWHMLRLAWLTRRKSLEDHSAGSLSYFKDMFGVKVQQYVNALTYKTKPRAVIICMIYYPLEAQFKQSSWATPQLKLLGYEWWPSQLQTAIRAMYEIATSNIRVGGTEIVPCPLYEVLDGKSADDYTDRVEPNDEGGRKMAVRFAKMLQQYW
ncbi:hypothetical protein BKA63DRAFT_102351 [Paraphoma chrysanthemicola]|nr:hypothetical protein BKA63DRAFT_102351 [Paraphoma chrysanthemicola]